jgi:uncharacterized YigZ family protein
VIAELEIKRSRFICHVAPTASEEAANDFIASIRKTHWNASHNCVALRIGVDGNIKRSSDDGEPSGTAGVPMLEVLRARKITDVVCVVTRYFGGTMLGAGGLVRAYGAAVSNALDQAEVLERETMEVLELETSHASMGKIDNWLRTWLRTNGGALAEPKYCEIGVTLRALVPTTTTSKFKDDVGEASGGAIIPISKGQRVVTRPSKRQ